MNNAQISISDILGRIYEKRIVNMAAGINNITFNVASFSPGVYILRVNSADGKSEQVKFIKK